MNRNVQITMRGICRPDGAWAWALADARTTKMPLLTELEIGLFRSYKDDAPTGLPVR